MFLVFTPTFGEDEPILTHIFQMGWFNHQLDYVEMFFLEWQKDHNENVAPQVMKTNLWYCKFESYEVLLGTFMWIMLLMVQKSGSHYLQGFSTIPRGSPDFWTISQCLTFHQPPRLERSRQSGPKLFEEKPVRNVQVYPPVESKIFAPKKLGGWKTRKFPFVGGFPERVRTVSFKEGGNSRKFAQDKLISDSARTNSQKPQSFGSGIGRKTTRSLQKPLWDSPKK